MAFCIEVSLFCGILIDFTIKGNYKWKSFKGALNKSPKTLNDFSYGFNTELAN